ncbi:uncharacterized protein LOC118756838, partial [Rhagoletis pomonella]|uniref:uncharacterized protein LOC118756838 n=1 Tax=Rhagoletis pomonella TaxID=28610 RepID=UPI0017826875
MINGDESFTDTKPVVVASPSLKAPSFCPERVNLWFAQLEAQFQIHNIITEIYRFSYAVSLIDTRYAVEVETLIIKPPSNNPYSELKKVLTSCFTKSEEAKLRQLLDGEQIGDRTPSKFLRHLKALAPNVDEAVVKTKWLSGLPEQTRALLAVQTNASLEEQSRMADKLHEIVQGRVAAMQTQPSTMHSAMEEKINALSQQIDALSKQFNQHRGRSTSRNHHRAKNRSPSGKRQLESLEADSDSATSSRRLFVKDRVTRTQYLVDTGSNLSVYPRDLLNKASCNPIGYQLYAANGTLIQTYGLITLVPDLGLRRDFTWRFIVADVTKPIIGADFLSHFDLLVDLKRKCLRDGITNLTSKIMLLNTKSAESIKAIGGDSVYIRLIREYEDITKPDTSYSRTIKHTTMHHIKTTDGPPVKCKARRLCPQKLNIAQAEYRKMISLGVCQTSDSAWSSPLHLVQKKSGKWRPCGDYRPLNARTIPDNYSLRYVEDFAANLH